MQSSLVALRVLTFLDGTPVLVALMDVAVIAAVIALIARAAISR